MANNIFTEDKDCLKTLNLIEDHLNQEKLSLESFGIRKIILRKSSQLCQKSPALAWYVFKVLAWHATEPARDRSKPALLR